MLPVLMVSQYILRLTNWLIGRVIRLLPTEDLRDHAHPIRCVGPVRAICRDDLAGRSGKCKSCQNRIIVPLPDSPEADRKHSSELLDASSGGSRRDKKNDKKRQNGSANDLLREGQNSAISRAVQFLYPPDSELAYWRRGGYISLCFVPPICLISFHLSRGRSVTESLFGVFVFYVFSFFAIGMVYLLCDSKNVLLKVLGFTLRTVDSSFDCRRGHFGTVSFAPGAFIR
jgi:hypothetical protein